MGTHWVEFQLLLPSVAYGMHFSPSGQSCSHWLQVWTVPPSWLTNEELSVTTVSEPVASVSSLVVPPVVALVVDVDGFPVVVVVVDPVGPVVDPDVPLPLSPSPMGARRHPGTRHTHSIKTAHRFGTIRS
jgi:hypothetical protein